MAAQCSVLLVSLLLLLFGCRVVSAQDQQSVCPPPGHSDGEPQHFFDDEPRAGDVCNSTLSGPTQRLVNRCLPKFCCSDDCDCNSHDLRDSSTPDCTRMLTCYTLRLDANAKKRVCCPGTLFVLATRSCVAPEKCANSTLGCEYKCVEHEGNSSRVAVCDCPPGFSLSSADNRTCQADRKTDTVDDRHVVGTGTSHDREPFPKQHIAAIAVGVGGFLLLLLVLLLIGCCCCCGAAYRRRRHPQNAAADDDKVATSKKLPVYGVVVVGEGDEKKCKKFEEENPGEIVIVADYNDVKKPTSTTLVIGGETAFGQSSTDDDLTATMGVRARRAAALAAAASTDRAEPNPYVTLPTAAAGGRKEQATAAGAGGGNGGGGVEAGDGRRVVEEEYGGGEYEEIADVIAAVDSIRL